MSRFDDQVAIVTGAGSGTGAAIATQLAEEGASIFCTDLDGAEQTAALLGERGRAVRLDVADAGSVARLMTEVRETHGRLDALFNCADRWHGAAAGRSFPRRTSSSSCGSISRACS